jgi:hypothetical protein
MRLIDRLRLNREVIQAYKAARASGKDHDEASEAVMETMHQKYSSGAAGFDFAAIIEIILMILALFAK